LAGAKLGTSRVSNSLLAAQEYYRREKASIDMPDYTCGSPKG